MRCYVTKVNSNISQNHQDLELKKYFRFLHENRPLPESHSAGTLNFRRLLEAHAEFRFQQQNSSQQKQTLSPQRAEQSRTAKQQPGVGVAGVQCIDLTHHRSQTFTQLPIESQAQGGGGGRLGATA